MVCRLERQAIIWTNAGILLIGHLETNFSEILIVQENVWKMVAILSWPQCVNEKRSFLLSDIISFIEEILMVLSLPTESVGTII